MDLRGLVSTKLTWILVLGLCVLTPVINSQIQSCSIEVIDLLQCLNRGNSSSMDICCTALGQVVQAGYNCLCWLVASSIPLVSTPISLPFSNCFISVPPLTLCRVLAPMPVVLPPDTPKELPQPSPSPKNVLLPPPSHEMQLPLNSATVDNSTTVATQPQEIENSVPKSSMFNDKNESSNGIDETNVLMLKSLFLCLALHVCILLA